MTNCESKGREASRDWDPYTGSGSQSGDLDDFIFQGEPTNPCSER